MRGGRFLVLVIALGAALFASVPAQAQSQNCGSSVIVGFGESLADIARRCGTTVSAIMEVNPLIPNRYFIFPGLKIQLPAPPPPATIDYVFRRGDTLLSIARAFGITLGDIYRLNPDVDASTLRAGDIIVLPNTGLPPPPPPPAATVRYTVRPGDTLRSISRAKNVALSEIYRLNPGIRTRDLRIGDVVLLPAPPTPPPAPPPTNTVTYTVKPGDTLYSIARANGMTVAQVLELNPGLDASRLRAGDVIRLRGGVVPPPPPPPTGAVATVTPTSGPAGTVVAVSASGFRASTKLRLMAGAKVASLQEFQQVTTDSRGNATANVRVPDWATSYGTLVFAYETLDGKLRAVTDTFRVAAVPSPPAPSNDIRVTGTLTREGVECQALRGDDGKLYTLTGRGLGDFFPGDRVRVDGKIAEVSNCMQGTTITVTRIVPAQ
jgi:LysM repeat protein